MQVHPGQQHRCRTLALKTLFLARNTHNMFNAWLIFGLN